MTPSAKGCWSRFANTFSAGLPYPTIPQCSWTDFTVLVRLGRPVRCPGTGVWEWSGRSDLYSSPSSILYDDGWDASLVTWDPLGGYTYNVDGSLRSRLEVEYTYVTSAGTRKLQWEKVTTLQAGVDDHVRSIQREYDALGRLERITSYATTTGGTIRNQIQFAYDKSGGIYQEYQSHEGQVSTASTPKVVYARDYTAASGVYTNGMRLASVTYPSGKSASGQFGSADTIDDRLHRTSQVQGNFTGPVLTLAQYKYNGLSNLVDTTYSQIGVQSRMDLADGDGTYEHLDRFGRIRTKDWRSGATIKDQFNYTHDFVGNRLTRRHSCNAVRDERSRPGVHLPGTTASIVSGLTVRACCRAARSSVPGRSRTGRWTRWATGRDWWRRPTAARRSVKRELTAPAGPANWRTSTAQLPTWPTTPAET